MKAYVFPGQGSQFFGMGTSLHTDNPLVGSMLEKANDILGFDIAHIMIHGSAEELKQTRVTQPAIFTHSTITAQTNPSFSPDMVAGHSLGEFSALVACKSLSFEQGLKLVAKRAEAMQKACEQNPSTMAAVTGLDDETVETICRSIGDSIVTANYNCPGQIIISGTLKSIEQACEKCKAANAKRVLPLSVGGAFHSPLMQPASDELNDAIDHTTFAPPQCPIYQNIDGMPHTDIATIRLNLKKQLTAPVLWKHTVENMAKDGADLFIECGPGKVLQGLVKRTLTNISTGSVS